MRLRQAFCALALSSVIAAPAFAAVGGGSVVDCADSFMPYTNEGYVSCRGPLAGELASLGSVNFDGSGSLRLIGLTGDASGAFAGLSGSSLFGQLELGQLQHGNFVIGVQGGTGYSLYLFNGGPSGIASISFDTLGLVDNAGVAGPALASAALFAASVPEPTPAALLLAGVAVLGFVGRRRALQAH